MALEENKFRHCFTYDPDHLRTCRHCYQKIQTQDGILESKYRFSCPKCHDWWKKINWGSTTLTIILIPIFIFYLLKWTEKKPKDDDYND